MDEQTGTNVTVFTYGLGIGSNMTILNKIACQHNGIAKSIPDDAGDNYLKNEMQSYYSYLAAGIELDNVAWTEPYNDSSLGYLTTTAIQWKIKF